MCDALEVSVSGFSVWRNREPGQHGREDAKRAEQINVTFQANRGVYGSPRVHADLHAQGIWCARKRVARLMGELGLSAQRSRHRTVTTQSDHPNQKWTTDTTSI